MRRMLATSEREVLAQLTGARVLLAFDFDGTLAPIVEDPARAQMRSVTAAHLAALCRRYPCAVISGRSRADVGRRLGAARPAYVVGNHGLEPGNQLRRFEAETAQALALLTELLAGTQGLELEDKRYSLAIHYRRARRKRAARLTIAQAVAALPQRQRVVPGKLVVNVVPADAPNKGDALLALRARAGADTALYVGDDVTDEDVFRLDQPGRLVSVRVGASRASAAAYHLRDQREIDSLLARLIELRENGRHARAP